MYKKDLIIIKIYIDNLLFRFKSHITLEWLRNQLMKEFQIKGLSKAKTIIG